MRRVLRILALISVFLGCLYIFTLLPWFGKLTEPTAQRTQMAATAPLPMKLPLARPSRAVREAYPYQGNCTAGKKDLNCVPQELGRVTDLIDEGKNEEARDLLLQVLKDRPGNVNALGTLGLIYLHRLDNPQAAANAFRRALEGNPDRMDVANNLSEIYLESPDLTEGIEVFRSIDKRHPRNGTVKLGLGELELEDGESEAAVYHLEQAVKLLPDVPRSYELLADAHLSNGHPERAIVAIRKLIKLQLEWRQERVLQGIDTEGPDEEIRRLRNRLADLGAN